METLRVFTNKNGKFGNPVGIVIDEHGYINDKERQEITLKSGFSEAVFIDDIEKGKISIFSPSGKIPFAGHAVLGTAYFLSPKLKKPLSRLVSMNKIIKVWKEKNLTWVEGKISIMPPWNYVQLESPKSVEDISSDKILKMKHTFVWAWINEKKGLVRARTFAPDWGILEDEANGSGSMKMVETLNRRLEIHHGKGSIIYAKPGKFGYVQAGGLVI